MITEDREDNQIERGKIKQCLTVLEDLDITCPQIELFNFEFIWTGDKNLSVYKQWFKTFEKCSIQYVKNKGLTDIGKFSALEYFRSNQKYLEGEIERKNYYINKLYHLEIDSINFKYLIVCHINTFISVRIKI
jgi:hypothetical protein